MRSPPILDWAGFALAACGALMAAASHNWPSMCWAIVAALSLFRVLSKGRV
jgi:hypothetical protein